MSAATAMPTRVSVSQRCLTAPSARVILLATSQSQARPIHTSKQRPSQARPIHTSKQRPSPPLHASPFALDGQPSALPPHVEAKPTTTHTQKDKTRSPMPLSVLPLNSVLRSLMTTTVSSTPMLLGPSMAIMTALANSKNPLLNPDRNSALRYILKKTFYAQFCAGENPLEVQRTINGLKDIGFSGVILGYAREVVMEDDDTKSLASYSDDARKETTRREIQAWADGTIQTLRLADEGDFVALKFTGAGLQALHHLSERRPPAPMLADAIDRICDLAASRGVRLLFDAEQQAVQAGIDGWTLAYMRRYNAADHAVVYGTYQAYLKATPQTLSAHLREARDGGFSLGVKLVRGAYLGSDPRSLIHDTKEETDAAYDGIAEALLKRQWRAPLDGAAKNEPFPAVSLVVASHNAESVRRARAILASGEARTTDVAFGQLQGMADEISCELVLGNKLAAKGSRAEEKKVVVPVKAEQVRAYKYLVWGSTGECMKYLLRRAHENRDAVQRTKGTRDAMLQELLRRAKAIFSWA